MKTVNINRLGDIQTEIDDLNREARQIVTNAVGYNNVLTLRSEAWFNNIKYALRNDNICGGVTMDQTLNELQEQIDCGDLEATE